MLHDKFHITLLSNVENPTGENTCAHFTTRLAERKRLEGKWMVGLRSISYTYSWDTLRNPADLSFYKLDAGTQTFLRHGYERVHAGHYPSTLALIAEMNKVIERSAVPLALDLINEKDRLPRVYVDEALNRVIIEAGVEQTNDDDKAPIYDYIYIKFSRELMYILGFDFDEISVRDRYVLQNGKYKWIATNPYDPKGGTHCILVNTDIIVPQHVGNIFSHTLEILPTPNSNVSYGDQIEHRFQNCDYVPLNTTEFDMITMYISTDDGQKMPFSFGRTIVKLEFVKIED